MARTADLATIRRLACWADWTVWTGRCLANGAPFETGPVVELELGTRAAGILLGR